MTHTATSQPCKFQIKVILSICFLICIGFASWHRYIYHWIAGVYLPLSLICFMTYAKDKWASIKDKWRVKESTLQIMALFGGWPGAILAQTWLKHKSSKKSFLVVFWLVTLVNICMLSLIIYQQYNQVI